MQKTRKFPANWDCFEFSVDAIFDSFLCRKRSPKSEEDSFVFPEPHSGKPSDKSELNSLARQQSQKSTTQHHVFAEPKPAVSHNIFYNFLFIA